MKQGSNSGLVCCYHFRSYARGKARGEARRPFPQFISYSPELESSFMIPLSEHHIIQRDKLQCFNIVVYMK